MKKIDFPDRPDVDIEIFSEADEFARFIEGSLHRDFINELNVRIHQLNELLEDEDLQWSGRHYDLFRGGIKNMRQMKEIFHGLRENKEAQMNLTNEEEKGAT